MTLPQPHIGAMASYQLANLEAPEGTRLISMAQNESLRAPSPLALDAAHMALSAGATYPDPDWSELRAAISLVHGLPEDRILCGAGSMELIASIANAYLGTGDEVLTSDYAYAFIKTVTQFTNARFCSVPEINLAVSTDALIGGITPATKIVFVANPGNPTGTRISSAKLRELRQALPENILLIIDEAYGEFSDHLDERLFDLSETTNTIILRTLSKSYGLAGMRVGWGCFPEHISEQVRKILNPNNVSIASQSAATAAMHDQDYMSETCRITAQLRDRFSEQLQELDIQVKSSHTNFVLLQFRNNAEASHANRHLVKNGILMRQMQGYGLGHCLRATIVAQDDMMFVTTRLNEWSRTR
ncbi:pyridoxal phosphate-dependent aminotransferase [Coralliovum pocilloporae]|uniref:pyridoxal phosphate-dependent aminotransferase n=1 Tax=Coralliovum pocilloporae TaxID=3066369 RepID=UPI0033074E24